MVKIFDHKHKGMTIRVESPGDKSNPIVKITDISKHEHVATFDFNPGPFARLRHYLKHRKDVKVDYGICKQCKKEQATSHSGECKKCCKILFLNCNVDVFPFKLDLPDYEVEDDPKD